MWELVKAGGWLMLPLILCSILTVAISIERFVRLRR
ncbi:MotA/TolQ/ExbB proton channel family protein, partial [Acinetobacter baumannii]